MSSWYSFSAISPGAVQDVPFPPALLVLPFPPQQTMACSPMAFSLPSWRYLCQTTLIFFQRQRCNAVCNARVHQREQQILAAVERKCSCKYFRE